MNPPVSTPFSPEARAALIVFLTQYIRTLGATSADHTAAFAKGAAIACLETDIDILMFVTAITVLYGPNFLLLAAGASKSPHPDDPGLIATLLVDSIIQGREADIEEHARKHPRV